MAVDIGPALGLTADSSSIVKATDELKDLSAAAKHAQTAAQGLVTGTDKLATSTGKVATVTGKAVAATGNLAPKMSQGAYQARMMALQLSQVAQQSMAGGDFVRALSIQLPDMATGFGAVGIAAGVLAGVALPALISMFSKTGVSAEDLLKSLDGMSDKTEAYAAAAALARAPTEELAESFGFLSEQAREAFAALAARLPSWSMA
jgi:hypothetical protein